MSRLVLSAEGRQLVDQVISHRREALAAVLEHLPVEMRASLTAAMEAFAQASGKAETEDGRFALDLHG